MVTKTTRTGTMSDVDEELEEAPVKPQKKTVKKKAAQPKRVVEEETQDVQEDDFDGWDDEEISLDDLPQDEPIWIDGPTPEQAKAWKDQFGEVYITAMPSGKYFMWRPLSRFEYRSMVKQMEQMTSTGQLSQAEANLNNEEAITELCLLHPKLNRNELLKFDAGLPSSISQSVMEVSAFMPLDVRKL